MFQDCLLNNSYHFWLIKKQELIGGFIVFQVYAHEGHIHNLGIKTLYQKQGLGGMLLQETLSFCQKQNAAKIFLEVRHSNQNAQKLYKKFGFKEIGIRKNYYSSNNNNHENAIVFQFNNEDRCVCGL
jgi:ribosomal-protein-alanine N-acetyltransferase